MMRSLFSGVSGLRTHQTRMDVIGNNIANVNTTAFKSKQMNFSDMLYQTTQAATGANAANGTGGTNPRQIGLGVKGAAINTTITQEGANQSTGNPFDLKITGEAFFVVSDGTNTFYTRDGSFDVDDAGNLCMASTGYIVQGWGVDENGDIVQGSLGGINVTAMDTFEADATKSARISGIIDKNDSEFEDRAKGGKSVTVDVFDKAGYAYNLKFGILPTQTTTNGTRDITNREIEYGVGDLYKVDISKLTFTYQVTDANGNTETRTLSSSENPEFMKDLEDTIWTYVSGGDNTYQVQGNHALGTKDSNVTINLKNFLTTHPKYVGTTLANGALGNIETLTVNFSGDAGFMSTQPKYPLSDADKAKVSIISQDAVDQIYDGPNTTGGNAWAQYRVKGTYGGPNTVSITSIQQTYVDDNDNTQTDYVFKYNANDAIPDIPTSQNDNVVKILKLFQSKEVRPVYTTQEAKDISTIQKGSYDISLLAIIDANGKEISIDALKNGGTTSWNIQYDEGTGEFRYVGEEGNDSFSVNLSVLGSNFDNVNVDISGTVDGNNEKKCSVTGKKLDGRRIGTRSGVSIGTDGIVTALYSNGMSRKLGQICVGTFPNAMGLENAGDNLYQVTASSGDVAIVDIKASGTGSITSGILEMSNVDLSQEFTNMITTQRGFQANSRIITTSDTLLEELINLKR
ncbi:MAG: flagellar hook-basal body complex protein [Lachnospiraceae bacterium]|nr:flagellar hook-basal body complex protein [Lachnospiraceae bacterium]